MSGLDPRVAANGERPQARIPRAPEPVRPAPTR
jgi:hypothetical protein